MIGRKLMRIKATLAALLMSALIAGAAQAQTWNPTKPVRLITLTTAGGTLDMLARLIADDIAKQTGQQVIVENRLGAGGNVGAQALAKSDPDGHTIGMITVSTHGINPALYAANLRFDPIGDFEFVTVAVEAKNVAVAHPSLPVKNVTELAAYARQNPGKISFGSAGTGTSQHLSGELVKMVAGIDMVHVPYRGAAAATPDLLAGRIHLMFVTLADAQNHIAAGTLRALGVTSKQRAPALPDVIPMNEQEGFAGFDVSAWFGVAMPGKTPRPVVERYNQIIVAMLKRAEVASRLQGLGLDVIASSPDQTLEFVKAEIAKWAPVVKASGAKVE
jgi:tripartite-type tricarboxylate transporter receptor subunit TctC